MSALVRAAGRRWTVEETFQSAKGLTGLDEHQVRRWTSWHRWTTLAMLAHAFLVVTAAIERTTVTTPPGLAPLTCGEIQRLFTASPHRNHAAWGTDSVGHAGADDTRPVHGAATTNVRPSNSRDQDLQLEY